MPKTDKEVEAELLDAISEAVRSLSGLNPHGRTRGLLQLAEAWAWVVSPNQPHGGSAGESS
jgi:hypothetical protein